ncbi:MAG: aminotransferase class IV [Limisphaerales bacterium]
MIVYLNGRFVASDQAMVSVFDRGFLYGDGLFETMRIDAGHPWLWDAHAHRLSEGAKALRITLPSSPDQLRDALNELLRRNGLTDAIARISISRGAGHRGYSIRGSEQPTVVITVHPAAPFPANPPPPWRLRTAQARLPAGDPFAPFKTASKLLHILARAEAEEAGADEALLLNTSGHIAETSAANLFWIEKHGACTPHPDAGGLAGVTRGFVMGLLRNAGWEVREVLASPDALHAANGVFATVSTQGLVEVSHLDGSPLARDPRIADLQWMYRDAVRAPAPSA